MMITQHRPDDIVVGAMLLLWRKCQFVLAHLFDPSSIPRHRVVFGVEPGLDEVSIMLAQKVP